MRESSGISNLNLAVVGAKGCGKSGMLQMLYILPLVISDVLIGIVRACFLN